MSFYPIPTWLDKAFRYRGLKEIRGSRHNHIIVGWLHNLKGAWWRDDDTPWCGTFIAHCMVDSGLSVPTHWYRAKAWLDYGKPVPPRMGAIGIKGRRGGGHVFFYVGEDDTHYHALGGNQNNEVNVTRFPKKSVIDWRWPLQTTQNPNRFRPHYVNKNGVPTGGSQA